MSSLKQGMAYGLHVLLEPQQDKTNKMTCVPSEDSDQPV